MRRALMIVPLLAGLGLAACSIRAPELNASITQQSRAADWPVLVPLGPLLATTEAEPDALSAQTQGQTLLWRAADLRRRAARLRAIEVH